MICNSLKFACDCVVLEELGSGSTKLVEFRNLEKRSIEMTSDEPKDAISFIVSFDDVV
ncbi:MAG: hypothetical protein U5K37_13100 [Natrialbaceae archaeon]|nr:hypothetical protein [Natrialbaceae archaeon]